MRRLLWGRRATCLFDSHDVGMRPLHRSLGHLQLASKALPLALLLGKLRCQKEADERAAAPCKPGPYFCCIARTHLCILGQELRFVALRQLLGICQFLPESARGACRSALLAKFLPQPLSTKGGGRGTDEATHHAPIAFDSSDKSVV